MILALAEHTSLQIDLLPADPRNQSDPKMHLQGQLPAKLACHPHPAADTAAQVEGMFALPLVILLGPDGPICVRLVQSASGMCRELG